MSANETTLKKFDDTKMKHGRADQFKHKFETAKLRDMLREKCRIRIKESREKNFMISRNFLDEKKWFADVIKEELKDWEENFELLEVIYHELIDEFESDYEKETTSLAETAVSDVKVFCPSCQVFELMLNNRILSCSCGFTLNYNRTLKDFWNTAQKIVSEHEDACTCRLSFFTEPKNDTEMALNAYCKYCDFHAMFDN